MLFNYTNLRRLADLLPTVDPARFEMQYWRAVPAPADDLCRKWAQGSYAAEAINNIPHECGTAACAGGWAPHLLGIPVEENEDFGGYISRVFGEPGNAYTSLMLSDHIFGTHFVGRDNTIPATIERINRFITIASQGHPHV